jgi:hypothetical protein
MIREEKISSWNNAWGASWSGSDNTLLSDVGKITAQYVIDSMPEKQAVAAPVATAPTTPAKKSTTKKSKKK